MASTPDATIAAPADARPCLGCGYDLRGLGDEPRCPECGLLNVPQGYREEVWKLVDSGKWFFSGFFHPFKKRLPGWWWSLDRPGDVKNAWKAVLRNAVVAAAVVVAGGLAVDLFKLEIRYHWYFYDPNSEQREPHDIGDAVMLMNTRREIINVGTENNFSLAIAIRNAAQRGMRTNCTESHHVVIRPRADTVYAYAPNLFIAILLVWAFPATVGFLTQVRKSLPSFARPMRTVIAAANCESHQMIYNALLAVALIAVVCVVRLESGLDVRQRDDEFFLIALCAVFGLVGAARWIGPVRSDYTRQLIQSRAQAVRIVVLYGLVLPWATTLAILFLALSNAIGI